MKNFIAIILAGLALAGCSDDEKSDSYSYLFNCDEYIGKLEQRNPSFMKDKEYHTARRIECDAARGKISATFRNISYARVNVANDYQSFGEVPRATEMYKAAIAALFIDDSWKNRAMCLSAAMAAGLLASMDTVPQDERAKFAKQAAYWGNQDGTFFYAKFLEQGQGALRDLISAYAWYNVTVSFAEGKRSKSAQEMIARLDLELPMQARLQAQALSKNLDDEIQGRKDCKYMVN